MAVIIFFTYYCCLATNLTNGLFFLKIFDVMTRWLKIGIMSLLRNSSYVKISPKYPSLPYNKCTPIYWQQKMASNLFWWDVMRCDQLWCVVMRWNTTAKTTSSTYVTNQAKIDVVEFDVGLQKYVSDALRWDEVRCQN